VRIYKLFQKTNRSVAKQKTMSLSRLPHSAAESLVVHIAVFNGVWQHSEKGRTNDEVSGSDVFADYTAKHTHHTWLDYNTLKTKRRQLYIRNQSVPRCKHFPPRLFNPKRDLLCIRNQSVRRCKHFPPRLFKPQT